MPMNRNRFEGRLKQLTGKARELWGYHADDPSSVTAGLQQQRAGRVQERSGRAQEESCFQLDDFLQRNRGWNISRRQWK